MQNIIDYGGTALAVIDREGEKWLRGDQIGQPLGYTNAPDRAVRKLYQRHADEFAPSMTALMTVDTAGGPQETRLFSLRGAWLLALLARTEVAKRFRAWVLDLIEAEAKGRAARVAALEAQVAEAREVILLGNRRWQKINHYRTRGFEDGAIALLTGRAWGAIENEIGLMARAGCLAPLGSRPDYGPTQDEAESGHG